MGKYAKKIIIVLTEKFKKGKKVSVSRVKKKIGK